MASKKENFFRSLISDETGAISSKRFIVIFCVLLFAGLLIYDMQCINCKPPNEVIIDALAIIAIIALGGSSVDKFSLKYPARNDSESENNNN